LTIGRASNADIRLDEAGLEERHATFEQHPDRVVLRDLGTHEGSVVNGIALKNAVLHPGDQIAFDQHRFVLEAPGLPPRGHTDFATTPGGAVGNTQTMQAVTAPLADAGPRQAAPATAEATAGSRFNYWWLLGAAVVIGLALAAILVYGPR
jgi:pSer/pThr/pTyr-binding forkhead associated (FHA) protein